MSEIELLTQKLENYIEHNDDYHGKRDEELKSMSDKIDEMHQIFTATSLVGKFIKWIATFVIATGSAYLLIKQLFFHS